MADIKDILGVSRGPGADGDGEAQPKAKVPKAKPEKMKRPEGMSREAFALLGGSHPIATTELLSSMTGVGAKAKGPDKAKPKPSTKGIPTWQFKGFKNSARADGLQLLRWVKGFKDVSGRIREDEVADYFFAKFNKKNPVCRYNGYEYDAIVAPDSAGWSREETDQLFELCERFDLRFNIIADRFESLSGVRRSVEDLKERYFSVARKVLSSRGDSESTAAANSMARGAFNKAAETERKQAVLMMLLRTEQQIEEESAVLNEAKVIEERRKVEAAAQQAQAKRAAAAAAAAAAQAAAAAAADRAAAERAAAERAAAERAAAAAAAMPSASEASSGLLGAGGFGGPGGAGVGADSAYRSTPGPSFPLSAPVGPITVTPSDLRHPAVFPNDPGPHLPSLFTPAVQPSKPPGPGVYFRSVCTTVTAAEMTAGCSAKVIKAVEQTMQELGFGPLKKPKTFTRAVAGSWLALHSEVIALHEGRRGGGGTDGKKGTKRART